MGTVSTTLPSDGQTIDAADVNTPINAILSEFNGNIDNDNIKSAAAISGSKIADASITNAKLSTTAGELGGAWVAWTPTWTNLTVGNGTVVAKYTQVGKTIIGKIAITWGSTTSSSGTWQATTPVTGTSDFATDFSDVGVLRVRDDSSGAKYLGGVKLLDTTHFGFFVSTATAADITNTSPFTWATSDTLFATFTFEAA